ncbi:Phosphatidylinositol-bisphosphatase [Paragonimus heterotremus]|uniref:phosphoinositide 5-phosphatase n=1 Tax=Paragonimus heterotremus TaxID=100268 RepID=A0A8J4T4B8_9TREM|nr:Phosphatidylinositol-bisphosphatase [Paragonimus heterotremus]
MSFLKNCRVSFRRSLLENDPEASNFNHSVVLENRSTEGALLFESGAIVHLTVEDFSLRRLSYNKVMDAFACLGVLIPSLPSTSDSNVAAQLSFLVMVTGCTLTGKLPDHEVYRITGVQFVCLQAANFEDDSLSDVRKLLSSGAFYFGRSTLTGASYDLTINIQNRHLLKAASAGTDDIRLRNDSGLDFLWNGSLMCPLLQWGIKPDDWIVFIICGSFELCTVYCGAEQARMGIISRVSCRRPGTRFHARGVNDRGYVANFVETEQFIYLGTSVASHIQLRGSVPLFWEQPGIQVGSHKIQFSRGLDISLGAYERHFMHILSHYAATAIVNLLGCKQGEAMLSRAYQKLHSQSSFKDSISQIVFDYHSEVQSRNSKGLDWLQKQIDHFVLSWGHFAALDGRAEQCQTGALRINCVDCLDRTNAVQTLVGVQLILPRMLNSLNVDIRNQQFIVNRFVDGLRQLWQQNGDQVSRIYAGTGALGSGRSRLRDVQRSAVRTIQHSFFDTAKQEAMHTLLNQTNLQGWMRLVTERYLPRRLQCLPPTLLSNIMHRYSEFALPHTLRVFVGTWNVNGGKHFHSVAHKHESVTDWLLDLANTVKPDAKWGYKNPSYDDAQLSRPLDVFAIGFEEIVDLTTSNIVAGSKPTANQRDWGQFLQRHLNRDVHQRDAYTLISSVQLVGVCLFVFVRARLTPFLRDVATSSVKTGLGGAAGNKGGVAVRFQLGATSVCLVCSHFAAGQSAVRERNEDFNEICRRLSFPNGLNVLSHDYVFWCGDFNYRINLSGAEVKRLVSQSAWSDLLRSDQLTLEREAGNVFRGFQEGPIRFAPTYKYDLFCDDYDTSEKARSPAWTDRVLWRRVLLQFPSTDENGVLVMNPDSTSANNPYPSHLVIYNRAELKTSDHRPVAAIFHIDVHVISRDARRKVVLECLRDYGPIDATVAVSLSLVKSISQQPVALKDLPINLFRRFDFTDDLKAVGGLTKGVVLLVHFLTPDTALFTYENAKQASVAAEFLNGYIAPWTNSVGLPTVDGGYELHFTARLYTPDQPNGEQTTETADSPQWIQPLQRLVEIAEREEAVAQGQCITSDVFDAMPPDIKEVANSRDVVTYMNLEHRLLDVSTLEDSDSANDDCLTAPPSRKAPLRPAPPPRRPPAPNIPVCTNDGQPLTAMRSIADVSGNDRSNEQAVFPSSFISYSATASPEHSAATNHSLPSGSLLLAQPVDFQSVTSCLDLLSVGDETVSFGPNELNRPASSSNLAETYGVSVNPASLSTVFAPGDSRPPPLPRRPAPPPPSGPSSGSTVGESVINQQLQLHQLSKDDPFSLVGEESLQPLSESGVSSVGLIPTRPAPAPPVLPTLPPRPKPADASN